MPKKGSLPPRGTKAYYKRQYRLYHASPKAIKERTARGKARRMAGLKVGDPREADHKKPLNKGGSNTKSNIRVVSRRTNRIKGNTTDRGKPRKSSYTKKSGAKRTTSRKRTTTRRKPTTRKSSSKKSGRTRKYNGRKKSQKTAKKTTKRSTRRRKK